MKIIFEGKIFGSSEHFRDGLRAVSFSENSPKRMIELMRYNKRRSRFNFEPYGFAIERKYAEFLGIRPAIYGGNELFKGLSTRDRPYFQSEGANGIWREEKEWRDIGDFDFSIIPCNKIKIFVPNIEEKEFFQNLTSFEIINLH